MKRLLIVIIPLSGLFISPLVARAYCQPPAVYQGAENQYANQAAQQAYQRCMSNQMQRQQQQIQKVQQQQYQQQLRGIYNNY